jgi:hypothetical protein
LAKQAHLILEEGGSKQLNESVGVVEKALSRQFPDMMFKSFTYEPDHPDEVTYHSGQWLKFMAKANGESQPEPELTEQQKTFKQQVGEFLKLARPVLVQLGKEVWYSKEQLRRMQEGKEAGTGRIGTGTVKFKETEKIGKGETEKATVDSSQ